jgi:drug/metabolite transporter (DMT)-like permease
MDAISLLYVGTAAGKIVLTKSCFENLNFDFPILFSALSALTTTIAIWILFATGISKYSPDVVMKYVMKFVQISILTALDMGLTNTSISLISIALQQTIKATLPVAVIMLEKVIEGKQHSWAVHLCLVPLVMAPILSSMGSLSAADFDPVGTTCMFLAVIVSATKNVVIHSTVKKCKQEMGVVSFMWWLEIGVMIVFTPWAGFNGELSGVTGWLHSHSNFDGLTLIVVSLMGGFRAYTLTMVLAYSGSALYLVFINSLVQSLSIGTSIVLFHTLVTPQLGLGIAYSLIGCALYAVVKHSEKNVKLGSVSMADLAAKNKGESSRLLPSTEESQPRTPQEQTRAMLRVVVTTIGMLILVSVMVLGAPIPAGKGEGLVVSLKNSSAVTEGVVVSLKNVAAVLKNATHHAGGGKGK